VAREYVQGGGERDIILRSQRDSSVLRSCAVSNGDQNIRALLRWVGARLSGRRVPTASMPLRRGCGDDELKSTRTTQRDLLSVAAE
jgi:hypothetical protein